MRHLFLLLFLTLPARAQDLETTVDSLLSAWNGADRPGIAVAYFEGGRTVFQKAYGLANLEHGIAWQTDTVSDAGSVSKQFMGFAMVLLEEEGKLSLDDDIRTHLPELPDFGHPITIDDLIYHRSGLREIYATLAMIGRRGGDAIFQEEAQTLVKHQAELQFEPGSRYLYNNTEYMLLADIVEVVTGMEFHDWMRERIFAPLGMDDTTIMTRQGQVIPRVATSYSRNRNGEWSQIYDNSTIQGAGGIYTTVEDLGKWILLANLLAWPLARWMMSGWLQQFVYRTDIALWYFPVSLVVGVVLAFVTIGGKTWRAAHANPVRSLRYE